jgi:hypothetical protein
VHSSAIPLAVGTTIADRPTESSRTCALTPTLDNWRQSAPWIKVANAVTGIQRSKSRQADPRMPAPLTPAIQPRNVDLSGFQSPRISIWLTHRHSRFNPCSVDVCTGTRADNNCTEYEPGVPGAIGCLRASLSLWKRLRRGLATIRPPDYLGGAEDIKQNRRKGPLFLAACVTGRVVCLNCHWPGLQVACEKGISQQQSLSQIPRRE